MRTEQEESEQAQQWEENPQVEEDVVEAVMAAEEEDASMQTPRRQVT